MEVHAVDKVLSQGQSAIEGTALRLPRRLRTGDRVGIVSTSSPVQADHVSRTRQYFEERGYRVCEGEHVLDSYGYMAGTAEARARDFNAMLNNPDIRMIVTARGGESAIQLLPLIEYGTLALDPKIICALSDPSILLNALTARSAVPTFHGPNGYDFGSEEPIAFTEENFWPLVTGERKYPHTLPVQERMKVLREGPAVNGWLWGGHMGTISGLLGTNFLPRWAGGILFLEEFIVNFPRTDALMTHFRLAGVFDRIRALVIGEPAEMDGSWETYAEIILRNCAGFSFPIVANVPLGHTPDKITLPIGGKARLDTAALRFELLEAVVR
jgi:muramoyltetrapeptide carboxypeptidase